MTQNSRGRSFVPTRVAGRAVAAGLSAGLVASVVAFAGPAFAAGTTTVDPDNASATTATNNVLTARIGGVDRYDTSVQFSQARFDKTAGKTLPAAIVIAAGADAQGNVGPDALAAAGLAGAEGPAPVLLAKGGSTSLPTSVVAELVRLKGLNGGAKVFIVGGDAVVTPEVETFLKSLFTNTNQVTRLGGKTRYETAQLVAAQITTDASSTTAILANGEGLADALSAGPLAYDQKSPIILTAAAGLSDAAKKALADYSKVLVVGGKGVVPDAVITQAEAVVGSGNVTRIAGGANRYETAQQVAEFEAGTTAVNGVNALGWGYANLVLARGDGSGPNFADALSAGSYAGAKTEPILLVSSPTAIPAETVKYHTDHKADITGITAAGGAASISNASLGAAAKAAGDAHAPAFSNGAIEALVPGTAADLVDNNGTASDTSDDKGATASVDIQAAGSLGANSTLVNFQVKDTAKATKSSTDNTVVADLKGVVSNGVKVVIKSGTPLSAAPLGANNAIPANTGYSSDPTAQGGPAAAAVTNTVTETVTVTVTSAATAADVANAVNATGGFGTASSLVSAAALVTSNPGLAPVGAVTLSGGSSTVQVNGFFDDALLASTPGTSNFGLSTDASNNTIEIPAASKVVKEYDGSYTVTFNLTADQRKAYADTSDGANRLFLSGVADLAGNQSDVYVTPLA